MHTERLRRQRCVAVSGCTALLLLAACSGDPAARFGELVVVEGAPFMPGDVPDGETYDVAGDIRDVDAAGLVVVVGTTVGALQPVAGELLALEVWSDEPTAPTVTAPVRLVERHQDAVLVLADDGLFYTDGARLLVSPDGESFGALGVVQMWHGDAGALWLATAVGLMVAQSGKLAAYVLDGEVGAPTAVEPAGPVLLVAYDDRLYELELGGEGAHRVPYATGRVAAMERGADGAVYIAAEQGLFERSASGVYTQYTLSSAAPEPVSALAYYPKDGTFALYRDGLVAAKPGTELRGVVSAAVVPGALSALAADDVGNLWLGAPGSLQRLAVGTPLSFAADVAPILERSCAGCHQSGASNVPQRDLAAFDVTVGLADVIVARMTSGQMPPAGAPPPSSSDVDTIQRWHLSGDAP